jgi:hypothetical protein
VGKVPLDGEGYFQCEYRHFSTKRGNFSIKNTSITDAFFQGNIEKTSGELDGKNEKIKLVVFIFYNNII